jgi:two-component system, NarL family, sensor histidine kinase UhpB
VTSIPLSPEFLRGLREGEATYRHLVEGAPAILYIDAVDEPSTNLYTSPQMERMLGYSVEEWRDDPELWLSRMHDADRERVVAQHRESNRTGAPFRAEYRLFARDGAERWVRDEAVIVRNDQGEPLFWRGVMLDITDQKRTEAQLRHSLQMLRRTTDERRVLLQRLEAAQEEERRRIADGIHDATIQMLSAADLRLQAARLLVESEEARAELAEVHETLKEAVDGLRHLLFELRPPVLDGDGLAAALDQYLSEGGPAYAIHDALSAEPPGDLRAVLFRIAQEAVTNVRKHGGAAKVQISLLEEDGGLRMRVADDGVGFEASLLDEPPRPGHIGLPTMFERAEMLGGRCTIETAPGRGTVVDCWVPLGEVVPAVEPSD